MKFFCYKLPVWIWRQFLDKIDYWRLYFAANYKYEPVSNFKEGIHKPDHTCLASSQYLSSHYYGPIPTNFANESKNGLFSTYLCFESIEC